METVSFYFNGIKNNSELISKYFKIDFKEEEVFEDWTINIVKQHMLHHINDNNVPIESISEVVISNKQILHISGLKNDMDIKEENIKSYDTDKIQIVGLLINKHYSRIAIVDKIFENRKGKTYVTDKLNSNAFEISMKFMKSIIPMLRDEVIDIYKIQYNGYIDIKVIWIDIIKSDKYKINTCNIDEIETEFRL